MADAAGSDSAESKKLCRRCGFRIGEHEGYGNCRKEAILYPNDPSTSLSKRYAKKIVEGTPLLTERDACRLAHRAFPYHRVDANGLWLSLEDWLRSGKVGSAFIE